MNLSYSRNHSFRFLAAVALFPFTALADFSIASSVERVHLRGHPV